MKGIKKISKEELHEIEPHVKGIKGIQVPETGIIDYKEVSLKYGRKYSKNGRSIQTGEKVLKIMPQKNTVIVETTKGAMKARLVVNCAGLYSDKVAKMTGQKINVKIIPFRGEYFKIKKKNIIWSTT